MNFTDSAQAIAQLQAEVLERVRQTRDAARTAFSDDIDECPTCGAPLYGEPCCEGQGE